MDGSLDGTLNHKKSDYLNCFEIKVDVQKLTQILDKDVLHWGNTKNKAKQRINRAKTDMEKFIAKQKKEMEE